jgi:hypothetical protein
MSDGCTDGSLQLQDIQVALAFFISADSLFVGNNFHLQFVIFDNTFDGLQVEPNVVCVEILELFDTLEFLDMIRGDLGDFQESDGTFVVDDCTSLDICLCLVGQFHNVLGFGVCHVLEDVQIDDRAEIVNVADKDNFLAASDQGVESPTIGESIEDITVSGRIPGFNGAVIRAGDGEEGVFDDSGETRLIEGENVNVVTLVLLNDALSVVFGVERIHQDEGDIATVRAIQVLLLE